MVWKKDNQQIENTQRFTAISKYSLNTQLMDLNINQLVSEDSGNYVCQVTNPFGSDSAQVHLTVQGSISSID